MTFLLIEIKCFDCFSYFFSFKDADTDTGSFKIEVGISVSGGVVLSLSYLCAGVVVRNDSRPRKSIWIYPKFPFLPFYTTYVVLSLKRNKRNELEQESHVCRDSLI